MTILKKHPFMRHLLAVLLVVVIAAIIIGRLYFASWLLEYANNAIRTVGPYQGSIQDISLDLCRGAYRIHKLAFVKKDAGIPTPFIAIDDVDLSIQWSALLHGRIVSDIELDHPMVNFAVNNGQKQTGTEVDWTKTIKDLMPIDINHVKLVDGSVTYKDFSSNPQVDIFIHHMNGEVDNLRNVVNPSEPLPSTVVIKGGSIGNGKLDIRGRMNILKQVPDMDVQAQLEDVDLTALNTYSDAYGAFKFKQGDFDLYSQVKVKDSAVNGYIKLLARHTQVDIDQASNPAEAAWATIVSAVIGVFTNPTQDQFATRVDVNGNLQNIQTDMWSALATILRNAFVQALQRGLDESGQSRTVPDKPAQ